LRKNNFLENLIDIRDVYKIYAIGEEKIYALNGINLIIKKNEYISLMGPSGSGKSTLMNILGCLDSPSRGSYFLNGIDVSTMSDTELAGVRNNQIGFVFQTFHLLPRLTAWENVAMPLIYAGIPKKERKERAMEMLNNVGLGNRTHHKPNELSGGQRQRVAIARALINHPSLILADEPTGNLDSRTSLEIMGLLEKIHADGNTVVLVTHEEDISLHARRIVKLKDGKITEDFVNYNMRTYA
jgi:putative ABC transport system ATP-binding protein